MTPSIDAVTLDLDDTLVEYERPSSEVLAVAFEHADVEELFTASDYFARFDDFIEPGITVERLRSNCFAAIAEARGHDPELGRAVADEFALERDQSRVRFLPGARAALDALAAAHRLAIVTNGAPEMQRQKLAAVGLDEWVDEVVYAGYDLPAKPRPEAFHHVLDRLGVTPERAAHVGNSLDSDVRGAKAAGLTAVWVPADPAVTPDPVPDYAFESLADLREPPWA